MVPRAGHFCFWFLEPVPLDGYWIGKARYMEKYQSYFSKKKKRIWKSYFKVVHRRVEDRGFFEKRQKVYALFCKKKT